MANQRLSESQIDRAGTAELTARDHALLSEVDSSLANALQLKAWWEQAHAADRYAKRFPTALTINRPDHSFAFFDEALINGRRVPVLGDLQDLFYDAVKAPRQVESEAACWMRDQIREFILRYFSRVSSSALPKAFEPGAPSPPAYLNPFGLCPGAGVEREGFGQSQLYYKLKSSGLIGKFPKEQRCAIIDMREIGTKYEWIVGNARMFGFNISVIPLGSSLPFFEIPLPENQLGIISKDFITNADDPSPGVLGEYGYGLATLRNPVYKSVVGYGPGYFDEAFMTFTWRVLSEGSVRARMVFVANQPERIVNPMLDPSTWAWKLADALSMGISSRLLTPLIEGLPLSVRSALVDPVFGGIAVANLATFGQAGQQLCISREDVMKLFLFYHFLAIYTLVVNSTQTWRQVPNWLDQDALPRWIHDAKCPPLT